MAQEGNQLSTETPEQWNLMFGSLLSLAEARKEDRMELAESWYETIKLWYPGLHEKVYCVPPVHFNKLNYSPIKEPVLKDYGVHEFKPVVYNNMKSDGAQHRILGTLTRYAERKKSAAFILSNMEFHSYLDKDYSSQQTYPKPDKMDPKEEGDFDVLVIDRRLGVFILELKAKGGDTIAAQNDFRDEKTTSKAIEEGLKKVIGQLEKGKNLMRKLLSDVDPCGEIKIRAGMCYPNATRAEVEEALNNALRDSKLAKRSQEVLCQADSTGNPTKDIKDCVNRISAMTFCKEDVLDTEVMTDEMFNRVDKVWEKLQQVEGRSKEMDEKLYEQVVARFCGPLTTVRIATEKCYPWVKLEDYPVGSIQYKAGKKKLVHEEANTTAGAARKLARRFAEIVFTKEQIQALQQDEDFVHLEGPPGTGKTLLLLFRILTWLEKEENMVWLLSLSPPSRSVTCVLYDQAVKKLKHRFDDKKVLESKLACLKKFIQTRPIWSLDDQYYERRLLKFRKRAIDAGKKKVCIVLDESGMDGRGLNEFFNQVELSRKEHFTMCPLAPTQQKPGFSVWSASVERVGRPPYLRSARKESTEEKFGVRTRLKLPLRCPANVQRALMLAQPSLNSSNVCCFKEKTLIPQPADPSKPSKEHWQRPGCLRKTLLINHGNHKGKDKAIWYCYQCGEDLASHLKETLKIGVEVCTCEEKKCVFEQGADKSEFCPDCNKLPKGSRPPADCHLRHIDTMIVATRQAGHNSIPLAGFALALFHKNIKVAVNVSKEDGDAPIPDEDVILITDLTSVHGLERAIIIIVPEAPVSSDAAAISEDSSQVPQARDSDFSDDEIGLNDFEPDVKSALMSMGPQCLKDFFYIGSRTLFEMILIHPGLKELDGGTPAREEEAMMTD